MTRPRFVARRAAAIAVGAISPLGRGDAALGLGELGEPARTAFAHDDRLAACGSSRPISGRIPVGVLPLPDEVDPAWAYLRASLDDVLAELTHRGVDPSKLRIGLSIGTSSGGMRTAEALFEARARGLDPGPRAHAEATYFAPFARSCDALRSRGVELARSAQLTTACAASTWAIGLALRWLREGAVDLAIAGGYDALGPFVAAGFESLRATTASRPQPFRAGRDGLALGEGAALVALVPEGSSLSQNPRFLIGGFGASTDAVHITAPDRTGQGLARAAQAALDDAGLEPAQLALVSAHGTATAFNDAMEARALALTLPGLDPPVFALKSQLGHALGAAGAIESIAAGEALRRQITPATAGEGPIDPDARVRLVERVEPLGPGAALKLSAAFGGANAALAIEAATSPAPPPREAPRARARLVAWASARAADPTAIGAAWGGDPFAIARLDPLSLLVATAAAAAIARAPLSDPVAWRDAAAIVAHGLATIDENERFYGRILARGFAGAEPRRFPATSPNLAVGQLAILLGLRGPTAALAQGSGTARAAVELAFTLLGAGDAPRALVIAVDDPGPASRAVIERIAPEEAASASPRAVAAVFEPAALDDPSALDAASLARVPIGSGLLAARALAALLAACPAVRADSSPP